MVFGYYHCLSRAQKAVYRRSDAVERIALPQPGRYADLVLNLEQALDGEQRRRVEQAVTALLDALVAGLSVPPLRCRVLSARPADDWGELHGLYEPEEEGTRARLTVWMRTARHKRVVAFRSFLRTILHEFCHHLDYELLQLSDSLHTEGFFKRESSLFHQLVRGEEPGERRER